MSNILEEVQHYVADKLNADPQLSACHFIAENRRDVEFEIKQALGKQGVVGLVMTPKATFAGAYMDVGIAWQLDELEIDIVENVLVNRGKKDGGYITGQDAAMRLFDVLCPLSGEGEGTFCPVSYDEGEDGSLLVNKCILKCLVHPDIPRSKYTYAVLDGELLSALYEGAFTDSMFRAFAPSSYTHITDLSIGTGIDSLSAYCLEYGNTLSSVVLPNTITELGDGAFYMSFGLRNVQMKEGISSIGQDCFFRCEALKTLEIPSTVQTIGRMAFKVNTNQYGPELSSVLFKGKTLAQVQSMENYPWGIRDTSIMSAELPPNKTKFTMVDGEVEEYDIDGELNTQWLVQNGFIRNGILGNWIKSVKSFEAGDNLSSIGASTFYKCSTLTDAVLNDSVQVIDNSAFNYCTALSSVTMPSGLVDIMEYAFNRCTSLTSITIPSTVVHIKADAFIHCTAMDDVYCWPNPN